MKNCTKELLIKFNHAKPREACHSPHSNKIPTFRSKVHELLVLNKEDAKSIQAIAGS